MGAGAGRHLGSIGGKRPAPFWIGTNAAADQRIFILLPPGTTYLHKIGKGSLTDTQVLTQSDRTAYTPYFPLPNRIFMFSQLHAVAHRTGQAVVGKDLKIHQSQATSPLRCVRHPRTQFFPRTMSIKLPRTPSCFSFLVILPILVALGLGTHSDTRAGTLRRIALTEQQGEFVNFGQWKEVADFIDQMVEKHGFDKAELQATLAQVKYVAAVIKQIQPAPPGRLKNWQAYRARFVEPLRVSAGVKFWNDYAGDLERAQIQYGVPAEIIVGIIGVETIYGRNTGNFRVLDALTTLAFDYPDTPTRTARMDFFRGELENTLLYARESGIDPLSLTGSYAGAIGWPQFMPSSIRAYAVDFNQDGKIDLRDSPADAIGSVAHFLAMHGWRPGCPLVFPATIRPPVGNDNLWISFIGQGLEARYTFDALAAAGVVPDTHVPTDLLYGLVDLQNGTEATEYWLGTDNFFAITRYNRSFFYAMSVIELGRTVSAVRNR